jgi:hypothetical protein
MRVGLLLWVSVVGFACSERVCDGPEGSCFGGYLPGYDAGAAALDASESASDAQAADAAMRDSDAAESQAADAARDSDAARSDAASGSGCESDSQDRQKAGHCSETCRGASGSPRGQARSGRARFQRWSRCPG